MSHFSTTTELQKHFASQWTAQGRTEKVAYQGYTDESKNYAEGSEPWARFTHNEAVTNQLSLENSPIYRSVGFITVQCFQRAKTGTDVAEKMADAVTAIYRLTQINGTSSGVIRNDPGTQPNAQRIGVDPFGWFQINVTIPYIRDVRGT